MSSFFTNGFAGICNPRRNNKKKDKTKGSSKKGKKDQGRWNMMTDAFGRQYWEHSVTGETRNIYGGSLVSPVGTVNPSPMVYPGGATVFSPSPLYAVTPATKKDKKKKGKGWWETKYDDDGDRYWEHTESKEILYEDPYE